MEKFIEYFAAQFDETDKSVFTEETVFRELEEWDSLTNLLIISMVSEKFDVALTKEDFQKANTLGELYNIVQSKI